MTRIVRSAPQYHVGNPLVNHTTTISILDPILFSISAIGKSYCNVFEEIVYLQGSVSMYSYIVQAKPFRKGQFCKL
jgi:hypothetical protein